MGATQVPTGVDVAAAIASGTQPEVACETVIYSGGGFSNVFEIPSYQEAAVAAYLATYPPPYSAGLYNSSGRARAFPDVSANGANYVVAVDGDFGLVYGTSASSPTVGGIITLINNELVAAGKSPVGFINPVLYANPDALNDVVNGTNPGCGTAGFDAAPGWDPVTGLGMSLFPCYGFRVLQGAILWTSADCEQERRITRSCWPCFRACNSFHKQVLPPTSST